MPVEIDRHEETATGLTGPSPVRWIVVGHLVLWLTAFALFLRFPEILALRLGSLGIAAAQVALLAIWLNFARELKSRRLFAIAGYLTLVVALQAPINWWTLAAFLTGYPFAAGVVALLGLPLTMIRMEGMRLRRFDRQQLPPPWRLQFSVFHMLWIMAFVALVFGIGQIALDPGSVSAVRVMAALGMFCVIAAVVISVPLVAAWAVLTPGPILPRLAAAVMAWLLGGLVIGSFYGTTALALRVSVPVFVVAVVLLASTLGLVRRLGYRLVWRELGQR